MIKVKDEKRGMYEGTGWIDKGQDVISKEKDQGKGENMWRKEKGRGSEGVMTRISVQCVAPVIISPTPV